VCCSVLQCVAVCCSVLQCVAVCCSVLQGVAVCCRVLQYVAVCCSTLQCVTVHRSALQYAAARRSHFPLLSFLSCLCSTSSSIRLCPPPPAPPRNVKRLDLTALRSHICLFITFVFFHFFLLTFSRPLAFLLMLSFSRA